MSSAKGLDLVDLVVEARKRFAAFESSKLGWLDDLGLHEGMKSR